MYVGLKIHNVCIINLVGFVFKKGKQHTPAGEFLLFDFFFQYIYIYTIGSLLLR